MSKRIVITMDDNVYDILCIKAKREYMSISSFSRRILSEALLSKKKAIRNDIPILDNDEDEENIKPVKKRRKIKIPFGSLKGMEGGIWRDEKGEEFIEDKDGNYIPYDMDDDENVTDM